jgi:hypothetical protein
MAQIEVLGAHYVLRGVNPGRTLRLNEIICQGHVDELTLRREVDKLAFDGQVKRLYVGERVMVKKTDEFDPEDPVAVDYEGESPTFLVPATYEKPETRGLDPTEGYEIDR